MVFLVIVCIGLWSVVNVVCLVPYGDLPIAECSLQNVTLELTGDHHWSVNHTTTDRPQSGPTLSYPNYVRVQRCVGGCGRTGLSNRLHQCRPTSVVVRQVVQVVTGLGPRLTHTTVVAVVEHVGPCECHCRHNANGTCPLAAQRFDRDRCRCVCDTLDTVAHRRTRVQCAAQRLPWGSRFWDDTRCECRCPQFFASYVRLQPPPKRMCSPRKVFDHQRCGCVSSKKAKLKSKIKLVETKNERNATEN